MLRFSGGTTGWVFFPPVQHSVPPKQPHDRFLRTRVEIARSNGIDGSSSFLALLRFWVHCQWCRCLMSSSTTVRGHHYPRRPRDLLGTLPAAPLPHLELHPGTTFPADPEILGARTEGARTNAASNLRQQVPSSLSSRIGGAAALLIPPSIFPRYPTLFDFH